MARQVNISSIAKTLPAAASTHIQSLEQNVGQLEVPIRRLATVRDWQDSNSDPGWELASFGYFKIAAGVVPAMALADGGFIWLRAHGTYDPGTVVNPSLLVKLEMIQDLYGPAEAATYIGPDTAGSPGWGFTNSQTGNGNLTASGRFEFDVKINSLGLNATKELFATGFVQVAPEFENDGGIIDAEDEGQTYQIRQTYELDLSKEHYACFSMGFVTGDDSIHIDGIDAFLFGGRGGFDPGVR